MPAVKASHSATSLPGERLSSHKMPGHWLLARLGKRVLRPGGLELSERMIAALDIGEADDAVEFAPGLGITARRVLRRRPHSYTAIERDPSAAALVRRYLSRANQQCVVGRAERTGLATECASVVFGEAMLTMQSDDQQSKILAEASRLLRPHGRYAIHEMCLRPDTIDEQTRAAIQDDLTHVVHHPVRPLTVAEWRSALESFGFKIDSVAQAPMHLLEPRRMLRDEGLVGVMRILANLIRDREARQRMLEMRRMFRKYAAHLGAVMLIGTQIDEARP